MKRSLKMLLKMFIFTKPYRIQYIFGMIFFTSQIFTANFIQAIFLKNLSAAIINGSKQAVIDSVIQFIILFVGQLLITLMGIVLYNLSNIKIEKQMKLSLFNKYLMQSQLISQKQHSADVVNRLNVDADLAQKCLGNSFALVMFSTFTIIGSSSIIFFIDFRIGVLSIIIGTLSLLMQLKYTKRTKSLSENILTHNQQSIEVLSNILRGQETVKVNNYEKRILVRYAKKISKIYKFSQSKIVIQTYQNAFKIFFKWMSMAGVFGVGIYFVYRDSLDFPSFIMLPTLCLGVTEAMSGIGSEWNALQGPISAGKRLFEIIDLEYNEREGNTVISGFSSDIKINGLNFGYGEEQKLHSINLQIPIGKKVALVGESGSGKSTILKVIIGMFDIEKKSLYLDDMPIESVKRESWRNQFAYVDQECRLFHMSILENIRLGKLTATDLEVIDIAQKAGCSEFIDNFPDKYNTVISDNKSGLSGGEIQRICIARALLRDAPVLILDEFSSALDNETVKSIMNNIMTFDDQKTIVFATHDMDIAEKADVIYRFKNGKLVN